ncbi:MAG: DUF1259 domain-containing protein [Betaproteobacteria bacterium]|nr:DUF1259 domain-containing protein [Betaproteobacteria bacterium]
MKSMQTLLALFLGCLLAGGHASAAEHPLDTTRIEQLTGIHGKFDAEDGVFKVTLPRTDIKATVAGVKMVPALGLGAWAAFKRAGDKVMVMGDIVLLEDQVNPVMSAALDNGLEVTALHNHFFWDTPRIMFMHIGGVGEEDAIARAVGRVFARLKETIGAAPPEPVADIDPHKTSLDPEKIESVIGSHGTLKDGVFKIVIGREARMGGQTIGKGMGVNIWAAFAGSDEHAIVDGDFAMQEDEVQGVLKALRAADIDIVSLHNHMLGESPHYMFLHYWGVGSTTHLARGLRAALDTLHTSR